ncbi:SPOR domain-containing protein [Microbulbifer thermotolerans]|uniref:Carbamoyl-phosphate synthase small subunit n=1 Tax=Microbulbifer thermotolerans TaxID=252514 RepID=A0A143HQR6_MICTH|nr:SPOR domain-containing protein [Microbulbifer thermotolerans]AMX03836.1 carbamoyl-phosphate synthase small subunit [Microbulbifer thermotolerans]MCX2778667.1 SPOR domain-containing protein [Microbulbifer thermotolerans]MCX2783783.1 SPOR domain-containing protein [Microbulbifer thermotolerans]MCX2794137.1 SPOR domain-containing protein [Microbulbifer thermotolerans]MCX2801628.1 SPOR domain-containing protein [Microbulbifer thermotolerans]
MSRRNTRRRSTSSGKPAWVWFVLGNFVGGFVVFMIFLHGLKQDEKPAAAARQSPAEQQKEKSEQPRFDFYKMLKENEVAVPPPKTAQPVRRKSEESESETRWKIVEEEPKLVYILQAASFRDAKEADRLRAQLMLANLNVKVETARDNRGTWHRVLVGPYKSRSQVAKAREVLADHKLMPLVLKRPAR